MSQTEEPTGFHTYGRPFQEKLVSLILFDRQFADQIGEVLEYDFLESAHLRMFAKKVYEYRDKYNTHPTKEVMGSIINTEFAEEKEIIIERLKKFYVKRISEDQDIKDAVYIKEVALDFCKRQNIKKAMLQAVQLVQSSSYDQIEGVIREALKLGSDTDLGYDYLLDFEQRYLIKTRNPVSTGWKFIDNITQGGFGAGEMAMFIGASGAGKSFLATQLGAAGLLDNRNVVHFSLELSEEAVGKRYDSCITGIPLNDLYKQKDDVYTRIQDLDSRLFIKYYPPRMASVQTLRNHLDKLQRRDVEVGTIIVDYGDLLRMDMSGKRRYDLELGLVTEQLRALAGEFKCPLYNFSQSQRAGWNASELTMDHIAESFSKTHSCDFVATMSRTMEDRRNNTGKMYVCKSRFGPDGQIFPLHIDTSIARIDVLEALEETPEEVTRQEQEVALKSAKKLYKEQKKQQQGKGE